MGVWAKNGSDGQNWLVRWRGAARLCVVLAMGAALAACGGGSDGGGETPPPDPMPTPEPTPDPGPDPTPDPSLAITTAEAARFLSQSTFGPTAEDIDEVVSVGYSAWIEAEFAKPATLHLDGVLAAFPNGEFLDADGDPIPGLGFLPNHSFWAAAIEGDDQLRQRMAFALSQILVVSNRDVDLFRAPQALAAYMDILTEGAFGNYRDLLEDVTYSVAMADYLTYLRNAKGDMATGRVPDENYARELMQLFTIGLVELNQDGTPRLDGDGAPIETYDNADVTGLARVFTGLSLAGSNFFNINPATAGDALYSPLDVFPLFHSDLKKSFLTTTIPEFTGGEESIDMALDALFNHPNTAPFISRQLIQRFVASDPDPNYVRRVADAFDIGSYTLPNGAVVGEGRRGDLKAVIAAILFDEEARDAAALNDPEFGKLREPVIRFTHWARAFNVNDADASNEAFLIDASSASALAQHPYRSPSVFNFYRPGYIAPGTATGEAGLTAPELQIVSAGSIVGYANFMTAYIFNDTPKLDASAPAAFVPDYTVENALAEDPAALVDHLDILLTNGAMAPETRTRIIEFLNLIPIGDATRAEDLRIRAAFAVVMTMTAPEYIVLR
ncbi:MAG: DUF1800 domain-containing protein [Pseudomonadota bacterium]